LDSTPRPKNTDHDARTYPGQGSLVEGSYRPSRRRVPRWLVIAGAAVAVLLVAAVAFGGYWAFRLQSNIKSAALGAGGQRSEGPVDDRTDRLQVLILGTDTRDGKNAAYGTADQSSGYGQSDVMMLLDISANNQDVNVISFPRDLLVDVPSCEDQDSGRRYPARAGAMINSAMAEAGIGCAVDTVNGVTGFEIDHFMMADFNSVTELSNAVGGVEVCVDSAVFDPDSGLRLPEGTSSVQGDQALAFLRTRYAFADGGDLGRIQAQQAFLGSLTRKLKDEGTLRNPQKVLGIADTVTRNLTVDEGLASIPALLTIADRLKNIDPARVNFITVPTVPAADPNRLQLSEPEAGNLFGALRQSADLAGPAPAPAEAPPVETPQPDYDRSLQPVLIANGSTVPGRSHDLTPILTEAGFTSLSRIEAQPADETTIYYGPEFDDVAADVAALFGLPASKVQADPSVYGVQLYLGIDFTSGTKPSVTAPSARDVVAQTAEDRKCQAVNSLR
jgi:LCP family protein required for cell wall assembly